MAGDKSKKRKRGQVEQDSSSVDTSKPTAIFSPTGKPREHTLSVALPGSFLYNAHSFELKNILCGQIARALSVFCVDEVIIFDDGVEDDSDRSQQRVQDYGKPSTPANDLLALLLTYLETPPFMRKRLFPMNPDLGKAGLLPSLDLPHHLRKDEWCQFREGVTVLSDPPANGRSVVNVGLGTPVEIDVQIPPDTRVTIKMPATTKNYPYRVEAVAPTAPRQESGWYWGYDVRQADSLSAVFTECPGEGGYDTSIGTSERGRPVQEVLRLWSDAVDGQAKKDVMNGEAAEMTKIEAMQNYSHLLLVFGGHQGLEVAAKNDTQLQDMGVDGPEALFDWWVNLCPGQGSRTIRTEEAIWLGLTAFRPVVEARENS